MKINIMLLSSLSSLFVGCSSVEHNHGDVEQGYPKETSDAVYYSRSVATPSAYAIDVDPSWRGTREREELSRPLPLGCDVDFTGEPRYRVASGYYPLRHFHTLNNGAATSIESQDHYLKEYRGHKAQRHDHMSDYRRFILRSTFEQDSSELTPLMREELSFFVRELMTDPSRPYVTVIGHANADGASSYNQALSERRANVVADFMHNQGVPKSRVHEFGVGEATPVIGYRPEYDKVFNRRVELVTFASSASVPPEGCNVRNKDIRSVIPNRVSHSVFDGYQPNLGSPSYKNQVQDSGYPYYAVEPFYTHSLSGKE